MQRADHRCLRELSLSVDICPLPWRDHAQTVPCNGVSHGISEEGFNKQCQLLLGLDAFFPELVHLHSEDGCGSCG